HLLDAGAVVPAAVEQHQLARRRQVRGIALEVPLRHFALARLRQCDDAHLARVQPLGDGVDHATLAGGVAALEQDHHPLAGVRQPVREVVQLELERLERLLVLLLLHRLHRLHRLLPLQACWTSSSPSASDTASAHISANNAMTATSPNSWSTTPITPAASITPPVIVFDSAVYAARRSRSAMSMTCVVRPSRTPCSAIVSANTSVGKVHAETSTG